jgi:hypothetical protein
VDDFGDTFTPELRAREAALRDKLSGQKPRPPVQL